MQDRTDIPVGNGDGSVHCGSVGSTGPGSGLYGFTDGLLTHPDTLNVPPGLGQITLGVPMYSGSKHAS